MRKLPNRVFVAGIGTGVGKTVISAILAEALQANYWKPVQCGDVDNSDTDIVSSLVTNPVTTCYKEAYKFRTPSSPHYASKLENIEIKPDHLSVPESETRLIIEAAGGLMVPLSNDYLVIDLIKHLKASVILVSKNYLGSINHTLLSIEALKQRDIDLLGVVFNGRNYFDNEQIIHHFTEVLKLGEVEMAGELNREFIVQQAAHLTTTLSQFYEL